MKGKALYPKMDVLLSMMREILMESKLDDEKRLKEILAMLKSRLQMSLPLIGTYDGGAPLLVPTLRRSPSLKTIRTGIVVIMK